jgi:NADH-quinone oxidoreductase subunit M
MSGLLNGVFAALDAMLFYVFFEATLIPIPGDRGLGGLPRLCRGEFSSTLLGRC